MSSPTALLQQDWTGEVLFAVQGHAQAGAEESPAALSLQFGQRWLTLTAEPEGPSLRLLPGPWAPPAGVDLPVHDFAKRDPFARFLHCPLYGWWLLQGELGEWDGLLLTFDRREGLLVLAQPAGLEVLVVSAPR
jgi:hypothetical protein